MDFTSGRFREMREPQATRRSSTLAQGLSTPTPDPSKWGGE
jgi:hypothetical protein